MFVSVTCASSTVISSMRIEFLGTGGYHPNERRHTACVLLPEEGIVFDAGTSAFRVSPRKRTEELDIFLSHAHIDHIIGLTFFLVPVMAEGLHIRVHAVRTVLEAVRTHLFSEALFPVDPPFSMQELPPSGLWTPASPPAGAHHLTVRWTPLNAHPGGSVAYRVDRQGEAGSGSGDVSVAYVTDTVVDGSYTEFIRGVDLLIHECYFPDDRAEFAEKTGHSFASSVATLAREAEVGRLVTVHADPQNGSDDPIGLESMRRIFPSTELAEDGMVVEV
jgi:ribonuclease Z